MAGRYEVHIGFVGADGFLQDDKSELWSSHDTLLGAINSLPRFTFMNHPFKVAPDQLSAWFQFADNSYWFAQVHDTQPS